jgi:hypothetical protein
MGCNSPKTDSGAATPACDPAKGPCPCPCTSISLKVIRNATQSNVIGAKNWAAVKKATDEVIVEATTSPNSEDCWKLINWSGDAGSPGDKPNQRKLSRATSKKFHIAAEVCGHKDELDVWIIWADLDIKIGTGDTIDAGNDAPGLAPGHKWPSELGGGNNLGPISKEGTSLTYAYTIGKIQAKATLSPAGVEDVVARTAWLMRRKRTNKAFDNGVISDDSTDKNDTSSADWVDLDPKSGSSTREIYDLDAPGCSAKLVGTAINHTSEYYINFKQWVAVTLDSEAVCSDEKLWSYQARIDADKAASKVEINELRLSHITIPAGAHYPTR